MSKKITTTFTHLTVGIAAAISTGMVATSVVAAETEWAGFIENATYYREDVGLSKFRNTGQAEFETKFESDTFRSLKLNGTFRATYDGVYDLNDDEFGKNSGHAYLGENWHGRDTSTAVLTPGVSFPCENDPTLCNNLDGYMDHKESDAKTPDFNDQLDFIRELYISADKQLSNGDVLNIRLGKQQVVWGKTDLFRVLDVINPVDYSRHNIYDELEDIRIPQWMLTAEWRMGPNSVLDDSNLSMVWNFDKFRPNNLGTCGQSYRMIDAGCFFASSANLQLIPGGPYSQPVPIIHDVEDHDWSLANTQLGLKWEGVYGDATFSVNALTYRQQLPSLHFRPIAPGASVPAADGVFDIKFPRVNLLGGSIDYYSMGMDAVWRLEMAYTQGEEQPRDTDGHKETDMLRYVIGFDKNIILPELGTRSAFLLSTQLFGEHILDHERDMPNEADNWVGTLLFKGWYMNNRLSPQIIIAHDVGANATVYAPSVSWSPDNNWMFNAGVNIKSGGKKEFPWGVASAFGDPSPQTEPLARFTNGPIGVAHQEDEVQLSVRYSF
ncbi:DUF1302 family protein [Neptunomonas japonica]|uniref:DUF1302 family protein n=1 Tax=Neptunomonas japonica TaxID=417574 RepID=UPI000428F6CE|nr:DUF1302 family protein [Neptunomonas japonica]